MLRWTRHAWRAGLVWAAISAGPNAFAQPLSLQDSFRIGSGTGIQCTATLSASDRALGDMFDRAYSVVCRDAAVPIGNLYVLKQRGTDPATRLAALREAQVECATPGFVAMEEVGAVSTANCRLKDADVGYRVYTWRSGNNLYVAEGLTGYDSALRLGLRTLIADRPVDGEISIAITEAGSALSFARVQAGTLDPQQALAEAYRRNNAGYYAEASEFFGSLLASDDSASEPEALLNQALQQSNLGNHVAASDLFDRAADRIRGHPVLARMARNYRALHLLNQNQPRQALAELDRPLAQAELTAKDPIAELRIDAGTAERLNADSPVSRQLGAVGDGLLPADRIQILDGQAEALRGTIFRLQGRQDDAVRALDAASARLGAIRGGRVASTSWMRAQLLSELALIAEQRGDNAEAERQLQTATAIVGANYPGSAALLNSQARLAAFYSRTGQVASAMALFRQIVDANAETGEATAALRRTLTPYFALLVEQAGSYPDAVADLFKASQTLVRPGVAQTQAILARELSGGSGEASRLFRQSVTLTRDIERMRIEISRLGALSQPNESEVVRLAELRTQLALMERDQVATQAKLADFPRYRVVSGGAMTLAELQKELSEGEAYYKLVMVGNDGYALFATADTAKAFRLPMSASALETEVDAIRATISTVEDGRLVTYPFDVERAHTLYRALFQPIDGALANVRHLIFEPDGAMLRLPANLLVMEQAGIDAYLAKANRPNDDGFDFTDIKWLGRDRTISTAVSARSFRDVRRVGRSHAAKEYIGFGEHAPPDGVLRTASEVRGLLGESDSCSWPIAEWGRPISSAELRMANQVLGGTDGQVVTGSAFSDTALKARQDLSEYRILHFATHGLVTAPRPECPARPALMTSFGDGDSDGLLSFAEIYDLRIDADLVILSACDTAGKATVAATREAGVTTGGDQALDGLVRAFVGAGGRSVIASHWPVPDDYDATNRLISGLFAAAPGTSTGAALRAAERGLMDNAETSHPYYWAGFAIIGDGAAPVIAAR